MVVAYMYTGEEHMLRAHLRTWCNFFNDVLRQFRNSGYVLFQELGNLSRKPGVHMAVQEHLDWNIGVKRNLWTAGFCLQVCGCWRSANRFSNLVRISVWTGCTSFSGGDLLEKWHNTLGLGWWRRSFIGKDGCDEDFVGSYGQTNPHFDNCAKKTNDDDVIELHEHMVLIEMDQEKTGNRSIDRNAAFFL